MKISDRTIIVRICNRKRANVELELVEDSNHSILISKKGDSDLTMEYELTTKEKTFLENYLDQIDQKFSEEELSILIDTKSNFLDHPLIKINLLQPNEVSEYGRIINYKMSSDITKLLFNYK